MHFLTNMKNDVVFVYDKLVLTMSQTKAQRGDACIARLIYHNVYDFLFLKGSLPIYHCIRVHSTRNILSIKSLKYIIFVFLLIFYIKYMAKELKINLLLKVRLFKK